MFQNISAVQLGILLVIVLLVFGTKRLRNLGGDLGSAIKGFRKGMSEDEDSSANAAPEQLQTNNDTTKTSSESNTHSHS